MKDILQLQGFIGSVHFSSEDEVFFGKVEGINDLVTFEGASVKELKEAFEEAVRDYQELCSSSGKSPEKAFKGSFNVRLAPEIHRKAYQIAIMEGKTLNTFVQQAIEHEIYNKLPGPQKGALEA